MKTQIPKPGTDVKLVLVDSIEHEVRTTKVVQGTVVDTYDWAHYPGTFCILIPGDPVPERLVHMKYTISINGVLVEGWAEPNRWAMSWRIESNSARDVYYTVSYDGTDWSCQCKGYLYNGHCTHIRHVQAAEASCT